MMIVELVELLVESTLELVGSAVEGLIHVVAVMSDNGRRAPLYPGFHGAALVLRAALVTVLITQVNFDSSNARSKPAQHVSHDFLYVSD